VSRKRIDYLSKLRRAVQLLLIQRHRRPGVKGWELKRALGRRYLNIIKLVDEELARFGLTVKTIFTGDVSSPTAEDYDKAIFLVTFREPAKISDVLTAGLRIDDVGALAASLAYINSKGGSINRRELESILIEKLPRWRVDSLINRFIRLGYLESEGELLRIGWRAKAEIDLSLLSLNLLSSSHEG